MGGKTEGRTVHTQVRSCQGLMPLLCLILSFMARRALKPDGGSLHLVSLKACYSGFLSDLGNHLTFCICVLTVG